MLACLPIFLVAFSNEGSKHLVDSVVTVCPCYFVFFHLSLLPLHGRMPDLEQQFVDSCRRRPLKAFQSLPTGIVRLYDPGVHCSEERIGMRENMTDRELCHLSSHDTETMIEVWDNNFKP